MKFMIHFLFLQYFFTKSIIIFPFKKNDSEFYFEKDKKFSDYLYKRIYINITIGTPPQIIPTYLNFDKTSFYFSSEENKIYNKLDSSSYKQLEENKSYSKESFKYGNYSSDNFILINEKNKETKINNITFFLVSNHLYSDFKPGEMGLKLINNLEVTKSNFIFQLKNKQLINNTSFSLIFDNNNDGKLIIGTYPHLYDNKHFKKENLRLIKVEVYKNNPLWVTKFDNVYFGDKLIKEHVDDFIFKIEHSAIISSHSFFDECSKYFFKEYLDSYKCFIDKNESGYYFYYCDDDIDITKFPTLKFEHKIWNFTFELNYKDLFVKFGNKYYLLIIFEKYYNNLWTLGDIFLRKYNIVFDEGQKVMGFYHPSNNKNYLIIIPIFIILTICIILLIYLYYKCFYKKKRKIRNNEINDVYDYLS
jgi:hypothetical protein